MSQNRKMPSKPPICREWENEPEMIQKMKRFGWVELPKHSCWRCVDLFGTVKHGVGRQPIDGQRTRNSGCQLPCDSIV